MSAIVALALVASLSSTLVRARARARARALETVVLTSATWMAGVGMVATLLAMIGRFEATTVSLVAGASALLVWPWRRARGPFGPRRSGPRPGLGGGRGLALAVLVLLGLALRWPAADYALAGRDQGTYTLRAQHTLRTGRLHATDEVLAAAGREAGQRPGPADLQGLYARSGEPWRQDRYEAAYRPGFYLADLDTGDVHPQFFHLHPMLMATAGLVVGPARVADVGLLYAALSIVGLWAVARRLWPRGPWAGLATALWVVSPLAIWVQRTPLSEGPTVVMMVAGLLAVLRARDEPEPEALWTAGLLLGALAWIRGNGWLAAPVLLAAQWLVPPRDAKARAAGYLYAAVVGAAVLVHAPTTFPYLHDELLRQLPLPTEPTPGMLVVVTALGLTGWLVIERARPLRRWPTAAARVRSAGPWILAVGLVAGLVGYLALRSEPLTKPWSRLDPVAPLVGTPVLLLAALGLGRVVRGWPRTPSAAHAWLLGLGGVVVVTVGLYAQRNLPQLGLYYYGRYLVPELLPALLLLAVEGLRGVHGALGGPRPGRARRIVAGALTLAGGVGLGWSSAGVLVEHPVTRLQEFAGAGRVVDHLASRLPADAVVIAGGEGWHYGHTFNQVGGALAFRHGITVLPYATREAAYASLYELLVARPDATGQPPPPVFLLLNEATKHHTRRPDPARPADARAPSPEPRGTMRVASIDDLLPPPFVARRMDLVEMFLDRLTPVSDGPPTRVTRDGLRMALLRVEVDPTREAEMERWRLGAGPRGSTVEGPPGLQVSGTAPREGALCLGPEPVTLTLPEPGGAGRGPVSVVLVAAAGTAAHNHRWQVEIDGVPVGLDPPHLTPRHRDTLGPVTLRQRPRTIVVHGADEPTPQAPCPHGGLAELRLLGPDAAMLATAQTSAITFAPVRSLGHPVTPVAWVSGRGLSRHRQGLQPTPEVVGLSLRLDPGVPLRVPAAALPDGGREPLDVVVTLTKAAVGASARLELRVNGQPLPAIDPPDEREGSWQSPALRWEPAASATTGSAASAVEITIELRDADPGAHVWLRDIGLFSRAPPRPGRLSLE